MQQAQAAIAAEGYEEFDRLLGQMRQPQGQAQAGFVGMPQQDQGNSLLGYMNGMVTAGSSMPQNAQLQMSDGRGSRLSRRNKPSWSSDLLFSTAP